MPESESMMKYGGGGEANEYINDVPGVRSWSVADTCMEGGGVRVNVERVKEKRERTYQKERGRFIEEGGGER